MPDTKPSDYTAMMPLLWAGNNEFVGDKIECDGPLYQRLVQPLLLAALNIDPPLGSAGLAGAIVRQTLLAGGRACRPLIAREGLSNVLVEPAVKLLRERGATVRFDHELHKLEMSGRPHHVADFRRRQDRASDRTTRSCSRFRRARRRRSCPASKTPTQFVSILNAHFRCEPPPGTPPILGVVNGLVEWIFPFKRAAVDHHQRRRPADERAARAARHDIWNDVCAATGATRRAAALADRARAPRHIRGDARTGRAASRHRHRNGRTWSLPATGPPPDCRRPSKARSAPATRPPTTSSRAG